MIVQNDYYADLATRVIIPLMRPQQLPRWHQHVTPRINIEFDSFLLCTPMFSNLNNKRIQPQDFVCTDK
ncbi:CcdB family protein [Klebsiella quasipneumoniae]|nr:CcdB family protein [Klebsiella quasipneumoniae]MCJ9549527.1 CcdB family protein [Klebsiella quasipneumoniae]